MESTVLDEDGDDLVRGVYFSRSSSR